MQSAPKLRYLRFPRYFPENARNYAEKLTRINTEEKPVKGTGAMLCSEASCMRLTDKARKYKSTFVMHADLKAKTIELRHVTEADKELGNSQKPFTVSLSSLLRTQKKSWLVLAINRSPAQWLSNLLSELPRKATPT
jgi:hypothetical protein